MYKYRKIISITAAMLILFGTMAFGGISQVRAVDPGVYQVAGNPTCATLYTLHPDLYDLGPLLGFKYNSNPTEYLKHSLTAEGEDLWVLETGTPSDPNNWVEISNVILNSDGEGYIFDWASSLGIDAVIVKAKDALAYVYYPEEFGDEGLTAPNLQGVSHISFCYDYELTAEKTADAKVYKTIDWTIKKDVTPASASKFIGESATYDYTVTVTKYETYEWVVEGTITVKNPYIEPVVFEISDEVGGVPADVDCGEVTQLAANDGAPGGLDEVVCTYSISSHTEIANGSNVATVISKTTGVGGYVTDPVPFVFGDPILTEGSEPESITVGDTNVELPWSTGETATWNYSVTQDCSSNTELYGDFGFYSTYYKNTAIINETDGDSDSETVTLTCYAPILDKDASTNWEKKYDWTITKEPDGNYKGFIGDAAFDHGYVVKVDQTVTEQNFKVYGKIYVSNPADSPGNMTVSLVDKLDALTSATVDCGEGATSVTVAPGATESCDYSGYLAAKADGTNTATGTFNKIDFTTTEAYAFGEPTIVGYPTINVTDSFGGPLGSADGDKTFATYYKSFQCSETPGDYIDGVWIMDQYVNTATIVETGQKDTAKVDLTCYAPVINKDASASYDERHIWDVDKTVDPESQGGVAGDTLPWTWKVTVSETFVEENFLVTGKITVVNPAPSPIEVVLTDALNDGTQATITYCETPASEFVLIDNKLPLPAKTTATCYYKALPEDRTATLNTATGTFNGLSFVGTAPVNFVKTVVNGTATVTDDEIGLNKLLTAGEGPWTETGSDEHLCSTDRDDYFVDGVYTQGKWSITNWAYVKTGEILHDKDDAKTTYTCDASFVDVLKTTNGIVDPTKDIRFKLYDGTGAYLNDEVSTLGDLDGQLQFQTALVPGDSYTICESPVPAGYTFEISVDGGNVLTYAGPPGESNPTGEIQCFNFTAPEKSTTILFSINNRYPGGAPRTPGYWKNWSTCSGGNQQYTAAELGGPSAGVYLLDDLLPQTLGSFTIDDIYDSEGELILSTCQQGVAILSAQDIESGKNMANDAAYTLARALLAARLNQDAGACVPTAEMMEPWTTMSLEEVLTAADQVLIDVGFDGTGSVLSNKDKKLKETYNHALWLYGIIDDYNNSEICTGEPSH